ncbi:MAG: TIM barrel protein, partial [Microvirga sp.]
GEFQAGRAVAMPSFALNHRVAPRLGVERFFDLAAGLDVRAVEIRSDLAGVALADGSDPRAVRDAAAARHLRILSVNALQRFNDWNPARSEEAKAAADTARRAGAEALVLCPVNENGFWRENERRLAALREALAALAPILAAAGITGLVEPLGFAECSLRLKREAVEAIDDIGGAERFRLVHDTFHHVVAGEAEFFPTRTGLVHVSGVEGSVTREAMRDPDRVLVGPRDRLDNRGQLRALSAGGYAGHASFEPFADAISRSPDIAAELAASIAYLNDGPADRALDPARRATGTKPAG